MDFDTHYTKEQETFRVVVRGWLLENFPGAMDIPGDGRPLEAETQKRIKTFRRKLGEIGWLAPSWPKEIGGGGLSPALEVVLREELGRLKLPSIGDKGLWINMMLVWGSEEQKRRWVVPAVRGEIITWQTFGEPVAGSDIAGIQTKAQAHEGDYIIDGVKAFVTGRFDPDYLLTLAVTDNVRPRRLNLGVFMVDAKSPGVTIKTQKLLMGSERSIYLDNVLVPNDCLIGGLYQGYEIVQTILQQERGELIFRLTEQGTIESVQRYLKEERGLS